MYIEYRYTYHNLTPEKAIEFFKKATGVESPEFESDDYDTYTNYIVPNTYTTHTEFTEAPKIESPTNNDVQVGILLPKSNLKVVDSTRVNISGFSWDYPLSLEGEPIVIGDCRRFRILSAKIGLMLNFFIIYKKGEAPFPAILEMINAINSLKESVSQKFKFNIKTQKGMLMPYDLSMTGYDKRTIEVDIGGAYDFASAKCWAVSDVTDYLSKDIEGYDVLVPVVNIASPETLPESNYATLGNYVKVYPVGANTTTISYYDPNIDNFYYGTITSIATPFIYMFCRIE